MRWKRGLIVSLVWLAITLGGGVFVPGMLLKNKSLTPAQDKVIGETCGQALVFGLVIIWLVIFTQKPKA